MHNIQSITSNIKVEEITKAANGIKAISETITNNQIFADEEIADYIPLEPVVLGGLHYALESLADYIYFLSGAD